MPWKFTKKVKKIVSKEVIALGVIAVVMGISLCLLMLKALDIIIDSKGYLGKYFRIEFYPLIAIISIVLVFVVAIVDNNGLGGMSPNIIFSKEGYRKVVPEALDKLHGFNIKLEGGEISEELSNYINEKPQYSNIEYYISSNEEIVIRRVNIIANIIIVIIALICVINIMNTIATNQILRKKEFATLRTIGMSKKRICKMIALEGSIASIIASILGLIIGNYIGYTCISQVFSEEIKHQYIPAYFQMCLAVIVVIGISLAASIISIIKIGNQSIIEGIKDNE